MTEQPSQVIIQHGTNDLQTPITPEYIEECRQNILAMNKAITDRGFKLACSVAQPVLDDPKKFKKYIMRRLKGIRP